MNIFPVRPLVKTSANWWSDLTNWSSIIPVLISSLIKCQSISICFVLSWTGSCAMPRVAFLIQYNFNTDFCASPITASRDWIHNVLQTPKAIGLYSASVLDLATTTWFFLCHTPCIQILPTPSITYRSSPIRIRIVSQHQYIHDLHFQNFQVSTFKWSCLSFLEQLWNTQDQIASIRIWQGSWMY